MKKALGCSRIEPDSDCNFVNGEGSKRDKKYVESVFDAVREGEKKKATVERRFVVQRRAIESKVGDYKLCQKINVLIKNSV